MILSYNTLNTFIGCSCNLRTLYKPHTSGSPFPLYTGIMLFFLQSSGIQPYLTILLIRSIIQLVPKPPDVFIISLTTPVAQLLFPFYSFISCCNLFIRRQQGPITSVELTSPSHSFSRFMSFSIYFPNNRNT